MIGIFDSGIGGLSVFKEIYRLLPNENYIYYADNAYCPYGDKPREFVCKRASAITEHMIARGADVIVVACNTATAAAIKYLRENYTIPFVGMEPAVKPAIERTKTKVVGVLATAGTFKGELYRQTSDRYKGDVLIIERIGKGLVELVESGDFNSEKTLKAIMDCIQPMMENNADEIVLGCTHYPFLTEAIRHCYPSAEIINPAPAVAAQTMRILKDNGFTFRTMPGKIEFEASGDDTLLKEIGQKILAGNL